MLRPFLFQRGGYGHKETRKEQRRGAGPVSETIAITLVTKSEEGFERCPEQIIHNGIFHQGWDVGVHSSLTQVAASYLQQHQLRVGRILGLNCR
jgi:hypothetical protein